MSNENSQDRVYVDQVVETDFDINELTLGDLLRKVREAIRIHGTTAIVKDGSAGSYDNHDYLIIRKVPESDEAYEARMKKIRSKAERERKRDLLELQRLQKKLGLPGV